MKKLIIISISLLTSILFINSLAISQEIASIEGKVLDAGSGELLPFAMVFIAQDKITIDSIATDIDGVFSFNIKPGTYDLTTSYIGYAPQTHKDVIIKAQRLNRIDFALSAGMLLNTDEIVEYKAPLLEIDNTTTGEIVTSEDIRNLPTKNIAAVAASTASSSASRNETPIITEYESYSKIIENKPISPFRAPFSTFAIDVDRASYSNIRRFIENGKLPPKDAVRIEEMINYFNYDYPAPAIKTRPFAVYSQLTACPWNSENKLLHIGLQGKKIDLKNLPSSNLVFLIDVSGSMNSHNKLPLVKESFKLLVGNLKAEDQVAIITYSGKAEIALESTSVADKTKIIDAIDNLGTGGSTAGAEGIVTAYKIARTNFKQDGNNRVILATDGDFNIGISDNESLLKLIEKERKSGIFLSILGYGMGNYKDDKMQLLADAGNGNHSYIDDIQEAQKTLVTEMGGTLHTIAKDVKIQVEFNPAYVEKYRLIGYENRKMDAKDFRNDDKDAGELGAGHSVTALYEITPAKEEFVVVEDRLMYQKRGKSLKENKELGTVRMRYKTPTGYKAWEFGEKISIQAIPFDKIEDKTKHAAAIAEFGMLLRDSKYKEDASFSNIEATLESIDKEKYRTQEVLFLVKRAMEFSQVK